MEGKSEYKPVEGKSVSGDFTDATFEDKWKFPAIGSKVVLEFDFELEPSITWGGPIPGPGSLYGLFEPKMAGETGP